MNSILDCDRLDIFYTYDNIKKNVNFFPIRLCNFVLRKT